jgi:hypothetical protein
MAFSWMAEIVSLDSFQELTPAQQSQIIALAQQSDNLRMQKEMLGEINWGFNLTVYEEEKRNKCQLLNSQLRSYAEAIDKLIKQFNLYRSTDKFERDPLKRG